MSLNLKQLGTILNAISSKIKNSRGNWNQNDSNADDYIKNRTHYEAYEDVEVEKPLIITWDGNTDGKVQATFSESGEVTPIFKISDEILTEEQFKQSVCTAMGTSLPLLDAWEDGLANGYIICREDITAFMDPPLCIVREDNVELYDLVFPEKGIYSFNEEGFYFSRIATTYPTIEKQKVVHHLDPKYIKDMYYSSVEIKEIVLVDNLGPNDEERPQCNFIPGNKYTVIWNGTTYDNLICYSDGRYNIIADNENAPFYIDDDGGNGLYVEGNFETLTIIMVGEVEIPHPIDEKYIPDTIARITDIPDPPDIPEQVQSDWAQTYPSAVDFIKNKPTLGSLAAKDKVSKTDLESDVQSTLDGAIQNIECGSGISAEKTEDGVTIALDDNTKNIIDSAVQTVTTDVGLVAYRNSAEVQIGFDDNVVFLLNGGDAIQECDPGLYDSDCELVADWSTLTDTHNMQVEKFYNEYSYQYAGTPTYVIELISQDHPNEELYMVFDKDVGIIGNYAFYKSNLYEIILPPDITDIGKYAFGQCDNLKCITFTNNDNLINIGEGAFSNCGSLTSIEIPDSVTSIGSAAFANSGLISIDIPSSVTLFGRQAVSGCNNLEKITVDSNNITYYSDGNCVIRISDKEVIAGCKNSVIPTDGSVTSIGYTAFRRCAGLSNINIPNSITSLGEYSFEQCTGLTSIEIPNSVTFIGQNAFDGCINLTGTIILPDGISSIKNHTFRNCAKLDGIDIPDSVTYIGNYAFEGCENIGSFTIPNSVLRIGGSAFGKCTNLSSMTIPSSVQNIDGALFPHCTNLENIIVDVNNTAYHSNGNCIIHTKNKTLVSGCKNSIIPNDGSVVSIGDMAFYGISGLTNIIIPNSITSIGASAFFGCSNMTHVEIPDGVTKINNYTFSKCTNLQDAIIPSSVTNIGTWAFSECSNLMSVTVLATTPPVITGYTFSDCDALSEIKVPAGSVEVYKAAKYWSDYADKIVAITE